MFLLRVLYSIRVPLCTYLQCACEDSLIGMSDLQCNARSERLSSKGLLGQEYRSLVCRCLVTGSNRIKTRYPEVRIKPAAPANILTVTLRPLHIKQLRTAKIRFNFKHSFIPFIHMLYLGITSLNLSSNHIKNVNTFS